MPNAQKQYWFYKSNKIYNKIITEQEKYRFSESQKSN